jgi:hypothetical protein
MINRFVSLKTSDKTERQYQIYNKSQSKFYHDFTPYLFLDNFTSRSCKENICACVGEILFIFYSVLPVYSRFIMLFMYLYLSLVKYKYFQIYKQSCPCTEKYSIKYEIYHLYLSSYFAGISAKGTNPVIFCS